jgi:hypothetical protein
MQRNFTSAFQRITSLMQTEGKECAIYAIPVGCANERREQDVCAHGLRRTEMRLIAIPHIIISIAPYF